MTNELSERDDVDIDALPLAQDRGVGWQALRDAGAVCPAGESFILTSADAVDEAAKAPTVFSSRRAFDRLGSPLALIPIGTDPPDHTRYRRLLDPFFSPKRMAEREPQLRQSAAELIDAIAVRGQCELITDLATPYPSDVFLGLFGLPLRDRDRLNQWKDSILEFTSPSATKPSPEVLTHALELFTYLSEHITRRRQDNSGDDLLTRLIKTRDEGGSVRRGHPRVVFPLRVGRPRHRHRRPGVRFRPIGAGSVVEEAIGRGREPHPGVHRRVAPNRRPGPVRAARHHRRRRGRRHLAAQGHHRADELWVRQPRSGPLRRRR